MVKEEVDHLPCVGKDREKPESWRGSRVSPEGVETGEKPTCPEGFPAEAGGHFPLLGSVRKSGLSRFGVPVEELGEVLEGLD